MDNIIYLLVVSSLLCCEVSSQNCNDVLNRIKNIIQVSETDPTGELIFNVSKSASDSITYSITSPIEPVMQSYFRYFQNDTFFAFSLNMTLDLEQLYNSLGYDVQTIAFNFICGTIHKRTTIYIIPENEFNPSINITGDLSIPENTSVGTIVYSLRKRVSDKDIPASTTFVFVLTSTGRKTFALVNALTGEIKLDSPLDFESGNNSYILNISVTDSTDNTARTGYASLRVNILDVDDQGPEFVFPRCSTPCLVPEYTVVTELSYTGPLIVEPVAIRAKDIDTLNLPITYSIYDDTAGGSSNNESSGFFTIESSNGTIFQLRPASQALWRTYRLVVRAAEVGSIQPPALAVIRVRVNQKDSSLSNCQLPEDPKLEDVQSLKTAVIAVSVVLGVTILASAIIIFTLCHKYRKRAFQNYSMPMKGIQEEHPYSYINHSQIKT